VLPLTPTLLAHQQAARRRPALRVLLSRRRAAIPLLAFSPPETLAGTEAPHALAVSGAGTRIQVLNDAGTLRVRRDGGAWSGAIATLPAGAPVALAAVPGELVIAYADGTALRTLSSIDDGLTWTAPVTRVTEAVVIGSVALAGRQSNGNLCAFYSLGTTPVVKRLRRTSGTWAASGTTWTAGSAWATITGLAAVHAPNDFHLIVTGTAPLTGDAIVGAHLMGDGTLPANAWFGPTLIARADALSGVAFERPAIAWAGLPVAAWREVHAGPVADARVMLAQAVSGTLAPWAEPVPFTRDAPFGLALAATATELVAGSVAAMRSAPLADTLDVSDRLRELRWRLGPVASAGAIVLDDRGDDAGGQPLLSPGAGIEVSLGYRSGPGGAPEYGLTLRGAVALVERSRRGGQQAVRLAVEGPWERLAAYRAPATWLAPAGSTRGSAISWLAARAGIPLSSAGDLPPSGAWTTETVGFAIQAGESALAAALRLFEPTPDALRAESGFEICGLTPSDPVAATLGGPGHPLLAFEPAAGTRPAWVRIQGPDRSAEAFAGADLLRDAPALRARREMGATSDSLATAFADRLLARLRRASPVARARVPLHAGFQLYDVVAVVHPLAPGGAANYRVLGLEVDYRAGTRYEARLTLGEVV
jgi:hypothetical protein